MSVLKTYEGNESDFYPSKTFRLKGDRIEGIIDSLDAVKQAVNIALCTERFEYEVYSWDYGTETKNLIGKNREYILADLPRRISEALAEDDRIINVSNFNITFEREKANVSFTVHTIFGDYDEERGVMIG